MTVRCGFSEHHVVYTRRDFRVLQSPQLPEGENFIVAIGVYDNFSVAKGQSAEAWTERPREAALGATEQLLRRVQTDEPLLACDYEYRMPGEKSWSRSGHSGIPLGDRYGHVRAGPGLLEIEVRGVPDGSVNPIQERIDLRQLDRYLVTEHASISIRRSPQSLGWPRLLPELARFLRCCNEHEIRVRHHYAS
jgi:hypothetical protein